MRADATDSWTAQVRESGVRARRWLSGLGPAGRIGLATAVVVALIALSQGLTTPEPRPESLFGGQRFSPRQAVEMVRTLAEAGITARVLDGRIEVDPAALTDAHVALQKAGMAPRSLKALVDERPTHGLLSTSAEIERSQNRHRERLVEQAIQELDPGLSAVVQIYRDRPAGLGRSVPARVTVWLETEAAHPVRPQVVERINWTVRAWIPDIGPDGLMLLDSSGHPYILSGNPAIAERSHQRAREEELRGEILEQLDWITDVRVAVSIAPVPAEPQPLPAVLETVDPAAPLPAADVPTIALNEPLDPDPVEPLVQPAASPAPAPPQRPAGPVTVLVRVPNTYYAQLAASLSATIQRSPTAVDLQALVRDTESSIRRSVESVVPAGERGEILIERIYLATAAPRQPTAAESRRAVLDAWLPAAGGIAAGGLVLLAVFVLVSGKSRQSGRAPATTRARPDLRADAAETPAPSEQVRGLVRLDPAAAASVLQRWIGDGAGGAGS